MLDLTMIPAAAHPSALLHVGHGFAFACVCTLPSRDAIVVFLNIDQVAGEELVDVTLLQTCIFRLCS